MDGFSGPAGVFWPDQQPEAKRQRLNPDQQTLHWHSQSANTVQPLSLVGAPHWTPNYWNVNNFQHFHTPSQHLDYYQQLPVYHHQIQEQSVSSFDPNQTVALPLQWPSSDISHSQHTYGIFMNGLEPSESDFNAAPVQPEETDVLVCYGMISALEAKCNGRLSNTTPFVVDLESSEHFTSSNPITRGTISSHHGQMVQGLLDEETLQLYTLCTANADSAPTRAELGAQTSCTLEITVFGPWELFASIGLWFQDYDVYLQDPRTCHLNVKYCNPHKLALENLGTCPTLSEITSRKVGLGYMQDITARPDLLDLLNGQNDLEEAPTPSVIQAHLHKHQRQALNFMQQREKGWALGTDTQDIWEISDTTQGRYFINRVSNTHQEDPPQQFSGGIIADPMGLGKTLTMIALAAGDLDQRSGDPLELSSGHDSKPMVQATLIVVPQPLLGTWEEQLTDHVKSNGLNFCRHHGKSRLNTLSDLGSKNIVLTTYHTLSADWQASKGKGNHIMFSVRWRRVVLDEAHIVRNLKARMARAICDLDAVSRWAVTGTPIQNSLNDLAALLKFIRAFPYDEPKHFDRDISRLWKSGEDEEAVKRLKRVAKCLVLRRAKHTIDLPPRHDQLCVVEFSPAEKALYDTIRQQTIRKIDDALQHELELSTSGVYVNVLQQVESMRLVCDLGLHYQSRHEKKSSHESLDWPSVAQETFNTQREMEPIICSQCTSALDLTGTYMDDVAQEAPLFSQCLKYACPNCARRLRYAKQKMVCGHTPRCPVAPVSITDTALEETPGHLGLSPEAAPTEPPSKVKALIDDLQKQPSNVKSIVFSTWRLTLDVIESGLNQHNISCVRFDGKVPQTQRQVVLNRFKADPNVRVMLLTLSCGAVGLTLTEASRAYLMEPHWNPTIEEQALARIHRIGQTRAVTTVRFYVQGSFEERVMEVQESKKNLAGVLLSGHDGGHADDSLGALQRLRALL
ncbi:hypothetical protein P171DRAFT_430373 [Karstenula rhodostoma CBS 690.94]|uniref:Uncharacterized protein n=1 Tax=Karstenula rhodostoma CBS 690.94 TaxID=1392251 RepID=A0A9P4PL24_9PLEO|nr:hypothetical protein P171DRAFT_430373 [Karstenula rhodostoma CBS 690.94]